MRTPQEIVARIEELTANGDDFFGFQRSDLVGYLPFEFAKPHIKDGVTEADWKKVDVSDDLVLTEIRNYLPFAWDKANNQRGLSAGRSINHMQAWLWLLGEETAADRIDDYSEYGKPQLRSISEWVGFDWRAVDDGDWSLSPANLNFTRKLV